jgi:integrase
VSHTGVKSWRGFFRLNGKQIPMTFDRYPPMTVAAAHDAWRVARDLVRAGKDPRDTGRTDFAGVAAEWIERDQKKNRTARVTEQMLAREITPKWGHRPIESIGRRDVLDLIDGIADSGRVTMARRIHANLHRLFAWAVGRGIVSLNPLANLPKPGTAVKRDRVLTDAEIVKVWHGADKIGWPYGPPFQLLILTGGRREEIAQLKWSEINGDVIELQGARTKNGEPHSIPLSAPARGILETVPRIAGDFVFTVSGKAAIGGWGRAKADLDEIVQIPEWRTHDLRRTVATGLQKIGTPLQVTEAILGHTAGSRAGVVGIYQRHDYASEKHAALESWGAHVMALVEGREPGKVVPLRGR